MIKKQFSASSLLVMLLIIITVLSFIFLSRETVLKYYKLNLTYYSDYLQDKLKITKYDETYLNKQCYEEKKESVAIKLKTIQIGFLCKRISFFKQKISNTKYHKIDKLENWFELDKFIGHLYYISSLSELPTSSLDKPKIIITKQTINERLTQDFYGVILTENDFNLTDKKVYGALFSTIDNDEFGKKRLLTFKREIIMQIDDELSFWEYLPNSIWIKAND